MIQKTAILINEKFKNSSETNWDKIGLVVTQISHLYQLVKETNIDLILIDESHTEIKKSVATKLRRFNGLTEIWWLSPKDFSDKNYDDYIDGIINRDLGEKGIIQKIKHILHTKQLLKNYGIVSRAPQMKVIAETIERISETDISVLIVGPSGSGKELVARAIHNNSKRQGKAFVAVNCGAIAEGILESELFGHERGAFTGSVTKRDGLFHKANNGTIFLDEIGETKAEMQVKLLRVLEDGTYYPVGSSVVKKSDVRVVSATNRDLSDAINENLFRDDLYFRIGVVKIILPPLMDRTGDIQPLLKHFWPQDDLDYSDSALNLLIQYDWPGNIRQLKNFTERMKALKPKGMVDVDDVEMFLEEQYRSATHLPVATGKTVEEAGQELIYRAIISLGNEVKMLRDLIVSHMPGEPNINDISSSSDLLNESDSMEEMERKMIDKVLEQTGGNRKEAAELLGIGERTLYRKLNKYKIR